MNKKVSRKKVVKSQTRQEMRDALLGNKHLAKSEIVTLYGVRLELRQPTLGAILDGQDIEDSKARSIDMIIRFACVPGTHERVFEDGDRELILNWPFGDDLVLLQQTITKLSGLKVDDAEKELKTNPLKEQS